MFFSYKYLKLRHHKHGTETLKKKSSFLIKLFFLSLVIFKIHFWLCQVFNVLASSSFCSNRAMNSPEKLSRGMVGDWHFDASFGQSRGLSLFFFGCAEPLFAARGLSLAVARRSEFLLTCVQASHFCGYCCCRAQALERRLSTCVARV